jgi:hypothetical protein
VTDLILQEGSATLPISCAKDARTTTKTVMRKKELSGSAVMIVASSVS